jgi:hypothetical protein
MRSIAQARLKRSRAVELLAEGCDYEEIARQIGYTNRGSAWHAVSKALSERQAENIDHLRALEGDRLNALQAALWGPAMSGDLNAVNAVVRVISCRVRLFGLDHRSDSGAAGFPTALVVGSPEDNTGHPTVDGN